MPRNDTHDVRGTAPSPSPYPPSPCWESIMASGRSHERRARQRMAIMGIILVLAGLCVLLLPLALSIGGRPAHAATLPDDMDTAALSEARSYDRALADAGAATVGEAPDMFSTDRRPAYAADAVYQRQLGEGMRMASILIPSIGVDMPIGHGTGSTTLDTQAGHVYGTTLPIGDPGNAVVAAHRGLGARLLFYRLGELVVGDMVYTEAAGLTVAWKVDFVTRVDPGSPDERDLLRSDAGHVRLTLYTCDPPGLNTRRLIVRAHRVPYDSHAMASTRADPWEPTIVTAMAALATVTIVTASSPRTPRMRHCSGTASR